MANKTVDPELKRIPFIITIQKKIKDRVKTLSQKENKSMSEFVEDAIKEKIK